METVSCCGIMCSDCPVFIATEKNDESMRRFLAHEYSAAGAEFASEDMVCHGCRTVSADNNKFGRDCMIRKCCKENRVKLCAECKKFPCEKAEEFIPKGSEQRDRLEEMHEACKALL